MDKATETLFWARVCGVGTILGLVVTAVYGYPVFRESLERRRRHDNAGRATAMTRPLLVPVAMASVIFLVATAVLFDMWLYFSVYQTRPIYFWSAFVGSLIVLLAICWLAATAVIPRQQLVKREREWEEHAGKLMEQERAKWQKSQTVPKLRIHRATYGAGPHAEMSVTEQLQNLGRDAVVVHIDSTLGGLLPRDPASGVRKRFDVDYSYESDTIIHLSRLEPESGQTMRLVLPEDTDVVRLQEEKEKLSRELGALVKSLADAATSKGTPPLDDSSPRIYVEIRDQRRSGEVLPPSQPKVVLLLVNRGKSEAKNIHVDAIVVGKHRIEFDNMPSVIAPANGELVSPTLGLETGVLWRRDLIRPFVDVWSDLKTEEIVAPLRVTYCDFNNNVIETTCDLVFNTFEHSLVLTKGVNGKSPLSTRNFKFRRIAASIVEP